MKEIKLTGLDLTVYQETLKNGLNIYYLPITKNNTYNIEYGVNFGGKTLKFKCNNKTIDIPEGTAHYLEHKMFENEDGSSVYELFDSHATSNNAFTNDKRTIYVCSGTAAFEEDLDILLDFVSKPYFTDENIEKERGIIEQEIKQNEDNIYRTIYNLQLKGLYYSKEYQQTVIGTIDSIKKINKKLLYKIYNSFYTPNNMFLVITGNFNIKNASNIINKKLSNIKNPNNIELLPIKEKEQVKEKRIEKVGNNETNKILIAIKKDINNIKLSKLEIDVYTYILLEMLFGDSSSFRQQLFDKKIVTSFSVSNELNDNYLILRIFGSSDNIELFINRIEKELKNITLDEKTFNRIKKVIISGQVINSDYSGTMINNLVSYITLYDDIIPNRLEVLRNLNINTLNQLISNIDFTNKNITIIKKKN